MRADPAKVAASYRELSGAPLFHIDLAKEAPDFPYVPPPGAARSGRSLMAGGT